MPEEFVWAVWDAGDLLGLYRTEDLAQHAAAAVVAADVTGLASRQVDVVRVKVEDGS